MKIKLNSWFPTQSQWNNWSLPSKATYVSLILGLLALIITIITFFIPNNDKSIVGEPQVSTKYSGKPFLRYAKLESGMELSYEICFFNSGNHPAINFEYKNVIQKLVIGKDTIYIGHNNTNHKPPNRLVTEEKFCQIFEVTNSKMSSDQIKNFIKQFDLNNVSVFLEINYTYKDGLTGKVFSNFERSNIKVDRVEIH